VDFPDNPSRAELSRLLVAADPEVDPHRLVGLCCERTTGDAVSVSLLVPADDESGARADRSAQAARLLGRAVALLDAAGVRLEDVVVADEDGHDVDQLLCFGGFDALLVCAPHGTEPSPGLALAVRSARVHGLTVLGSADQRAGNASWLRRLLDPLGRRPRPGERAA
jgi:hypothetical protein